jgi:hypothetical protein
MTKFELSIKLCTFHFSHMLQKVKKYIFLPRSSIVRMNLSDVAPFLRFLAYNFLILQNFLKNRMKKIELSIKLCAFFYTDCIDFWISCPFDS